MFPPQKAPPPMKIHTTSLQFLSALCLAGAAQAQITFSIDRLGPVIATPSTCPGAPITGADILTPSSGLPCQASSAVVAPLPVPSIVIPGGPGGLGIATAAGCTGAPPGNNCPSEVDALSYGLDQIMTATGLTLPVSSIFFSVDEFAQGIPGSPFPPNVFSEGFLTGVNDAAADVFRNTIPMPLLPLGPGAPATAGNKGVIDGDANPSGSGAVYAGVGLREPRLPMFGPGPRTGDNIDALDIGKLPINTAGAIGPVYFSLDAAFPDVLRGIPNTNTALANGFLPGAVLVQNGGGAPVVYAMPMQLGLDLGGPATDDLDALALQENGLPGFQPINAGGVFGDRIIFSVRRGSAVIGMPDSLFGMPICEGDLLTVPTAPGLPPSMFIAAEWLGLNTFRVTPGVVSDELDALDIEVPMAPPGQPFCSGDGTLPTPCPCGNIGNPGAGCNNSAGTGGATLTATGSTTPDTVVLTSSGELATSTSIFLQATGVLPNGVVFGDGVRCINGGLRRLYVKNAVAGVVSAPVGAEPSITARSAALGDVLLPGMTRYYQVQYRDSAPFCTAANFNASSGFVITW